MKIAQFYDKNRIRLGIVEADSITPVDFQGEMIEFIEESASHTSSGKPLPLNAVRLAPPVTNPSKIVAIGRNYMEHIQEGNREVPESPMIFAKFPSSLIGHLGMITWDPNITKKVDFEAELAVIIGKRIYNCPETEVMEAIFGYTCSNDVSAKDLQYSDKQWVRGKSLDTFCPLGPWVVTSDEISDPQSLDIRCLLNGHLMQDSNTSMMIFKLPELISFISRHFTLLPGDIILTGTPQGVGTYRNPPIYMKEGDEVIVEIEKVGRLANRCRTL